MAKEAPKTIKVKMDDGREVEFGEKKRLQKEIILGDGPMEVAVRLDFVNGETRTFVLPESLFKQAAGHGASQKLGDEISDVKDLADAIEVIDQLMQRMENGDWYAASTGGAGMSGASTLAKALVEVTGQPIKVVRDYLATLDAKTKTALRVSAEVAPVIKRLDDEKAARAAARGEAAPTVDTASILGKLKAGLPVEAQSALPT
jgi:hypothetical protein